MIKTLSTIIVILFSPIIFPYKYVKHYLFVRAKNKAIKEANKRQKNTNKKIMVIQLEKTFKVGTNNELKNMDRFARKILKIKRSDSFIWNYRNAIIYNAK